MEVTSLNEADVRQEFWGEAGRELLLKGVQASQQAALAPTVDPRQVLGASTPLKTPACRFPSKVQNEGPGQQ